MLSHRIAATVASVAVIAACWAHTAQAAQDESTPRIAVTQTVEDLPLDNGNFQRVLYYGPESTVRGVIVMFPGGADDIGIERNGTIREGNNFLVRTRERWARKGYAVVIVDALDRQSMRGQRSTSAYVPVLKKIVAFAHRHTDAPVWAMGTSQGSIAAMSAASHAEPGQLAGVVLTESVSILGRSGETVFDAQPENVRVPALVVANASDACKVALPTMADKIAKSMRNTHVTVLHEQGGDAATPNTCGSLSPHGYYGIEDKVIDDIVGWMRETEKASTN
ncbi:alpha/beta hydrolase [Paraburkholderia flava]|uniref:alpha/beta hydrolase n=1 Tax=Paraburkholderia flava TaxID=2547393 RepID=UPI001F104C8A|nr:alpha/beta hydrolase [Paraburkholderia flava]